MALILIFVLECASMTVPEYKTFVIYLIILYGMYTLFRVDWCTWTDIFGEVDGTENREVLIYLDEL